MGRHNRERRAAKRRRKQAARTGPGRRPPGARAGRPHDGPWGAVGAEELAALAIAAWRAGDGRYAGLLAALEARGAPALGVVRRLLGDATAALWQRGWTAVEAVHVTRRTLSERHADLVAAVALDDLRGRGERGEPLAAGWQAQLAVLAERVAGPPPLPVGLLVEALALVLAMPDVPRTMPLPGDRFAAVGAAAGRLDERLLARVRALLAKAESTAFTEEAEALTAKAQELIARHAIDEALLQRDDAPGQPSLRRVLLDDPYADAKAALVTAVAGANRCRVVHTPAFGWCTVFGFDSDLNATELLLTSLLTQATRALASHGPRRDHLGRSTTRSFRRAFLYGFAHRIGQRLSEATDAEVAAAGAVQQRLLPVLASRDERVRAAEQAVFPHLVRRAASLSNAGGWVAGQAAADLAHLGVSAHSLQPTPPAPAPATER